MKELEAYPPQSGARLWLLLFRAFRRVERIDLDSVRKLGFKSITDFAILEVLLHQGPLTMGQIGDRVLLTSGSVTTAVDRAVAEDLVQRNADTVDRRVVRVELTPKGRALIEKTYQEHAAALNEGFNHLNNEERRIFTELMLKVAKGA